MDARERLQTLGAAGLTTKELLCVVLGSGVAGKPVCALAEELLALDLLSCSLDDLLAVNGVGLAKASLLVAALSLRERLSVAGGRLVLDSPDAVNAFMRDIRSLSQEHFYGLFLDSRKQLLAKHLLFKGTADATVVHPRDVFRHAVSENATSVIIVHNHPSGNCEPSSADVAFTKRLVRLGNAMHIPVIDHIIIGDSYWSYANSS